MRFLVGLSGGADSAAVALRLLQDGHEVQGVFLRLFEESDATAAAFVADKLGIDLQIVDDVARFRDTVIADFVREYARGRTPNPCALCNRTVKVQGLLESAEAFGCDKVATGHYADIGEERGRLFVRAGADETRDQSYFLWRLSQEQLSKLYFPLAHCRKGELSSQVESLLPEGTRESREVCFIPGDDRIAFLKARLSEEECIGGNFVDAQGNVLALHEGLYRYTVGQRKGFGIGFGKRVYVSRIEPESGNVVLTSREDCLKADAKITSIVRQKESETAGEREVLCRARYRAPLCKARLCYDGEVGSVHLLEGAKTVFAPGQSVVCYDENGSVLLGGVLEG